MVNILKKEKLPEEELMEELYEHVLTVYGPTNRNRNR